MRAASPSRLARLGLVILLGAAGCDHIERRTDNPAQEAWTSADAAMTKRLSALRDRKQRFADRVAALAVPEGTESPQLTSLLGELAGRIGTIDTAYKAADAARGQAQADATAALASPDRQAAERAVRGGQEAFEQAASAAEATIVGAEPLAAEGESLMRQLLASIANEIARLQKLAKEGGNIDFSDIDFAVGSSEFDFTHAASKATLNRLVDFARSCPELRFGLTGHTSKEGNPAKNRALSLARAEAVKTYLVTNGVGPDKITRTAGLGSTSTLADEPDPGTPAEAAMPRDQLDTIRRKNRRVNVDVTTPCAAAPAPGGAAEQVPPTPPVPTVMPTPVAPAGAGH